MLRRGHSGSDSGGARRARPPGRGDAQLGAASGRAEGAGGGVRHDDPWVDAVQMVEQSRPPDPTYDLGERDVRQTPEAVSASRMSAAPAAAPAAAASQASSAGLHRSARR